MGHYYFFHDAGHGWLQVQMAEFMNMPASLRAKISKHSYFDDEHVYLEEDCDATAFEHYLAGLDAEMSVVSIYDGCLSPIRRKKLYATELFLSKYGDLPNLKADMETLNEILSRQGSDLFFDVVAEYNGNAANKLKLDAMVRESLIRGLIISLSDALEERL